MPGETTRETTQRRAAEGYQCAISPGGRCTRLAVEFDVQPPASLSGDEHRMNPNRYIDTVEMHTGGEPFRIVTHGIPRIPGADILERRSWLQHNADHYRRELMLDRADMPTCTAGSSPNPSARPRTSVSSSCRTSTTAHTAATASLPWRPPRSNSAGWTDGTGDPRRHRCTMRLHRGIRRMGRARRRRRSIHQRAVVRVDARCLGGHTIVRHRQR